MSRGFVQGNGGTYPPSVARVGADEAQMSPTVRDVEVGHRAQVSAPASKNRSQELYELDSLTFLW